MSYEQFREQCADAGDLLRSPMKGTVSHGAIAFNEGFDTAIKGFQSAIRAMQLPEVTQEPVYLRWQYSKPSGGWIAATKDEYERDLKNGWKVRLAYELRPSVEALQKNNSALRKENEQLRSLLESAANGLRWYQDHHPEDGSEADYEMLEQIDAVLKGGA